MDLRSEYQAAFYYFDVETALEKIDAYVRREGFDESDEGEWCDYYYSLADFMWKKGILTEEVKKRTIGMIDAGVGLDIWEESGKAALRERKKVLEKFREKLCSEQPAPKKIIINLYMKPVFETGDVVAFQLQTKDQVYLPPDDRRSWLRSRFDEPFYRSCHGKWVVMRKAFDNVSYRSSIVPEVRNIWPYFQLYGAMFDECPTMEMLQGVPWAKTEHYPGTGVFWTEGTLSYLKKRNYRIIGSSLEDLVTAEQVDWNSDSIFFQSYGKECYADMALLNAIVE
ncbi:MAG: hypothetical protein IJA49_00145 [Oscillospiraceae bacterium]|nr:hypothetical protein [Oscillospiraceae bacterium]